MHFDGLLRVGYVQPPSIRLPAFRDDLNQSSSHGCVGNMGDAFPASLYVQFQLFVPLYDVFFDELDIHTSVFNRRVLLAAGHFNGDARLNIAACWATAKKPATQNKATKIVEGLINCFNPMVYGTTCPGQVIRLSL